MRAPSAAPAPAPFGLAWRGLSVLLVAAAVAVWTTRDSTYFMPGPVWLALGTVVLAILVVAPVRWRFAACVAGALLAGGLAGRVLLAPGMPRVHDLMHLWGIWSVGRALEEGALLPRWIPYLGAGIPLLQFYGPLNFVLALPGILLGLSPVGAWKLELFAGHVLSAASMLGAARVLGAGWRASLVAAVAGAFAPYRLTVFDYRGALAEANAFLFMPWIIAGAVRLLQAPSTRSAVLLVVAIAGLVLTHVVMLLPLGLALLPAVLVVGRATPRGDRLRRARWCAGALALALALTAWWWFPAVVESKSTSVHAFTEENVYYRYADNGVAPGDLLVRRGWDRLRVALPGPERDKPGLAGQQMPFYAGAVLVLGGLCAGWWSPRRRRESNRVEPWPLALGAAAALLLGTTLLDGLGAAGPLAAVRFPFRFLGPASILLGLALALGIEGLRESLPRHSVAVGTGLLIAGLVWDAAPYTGAADRIPAYEGTVHAFTDDPGWVHWDRSMRWSPVEIEPRQGVMRVRNLELPPSAYDTTIDAFHPAYYEWLTPEVYRRYWRADTPATIAPAGVGHGFVNSRDGAARWPARAYATLNGTRDSSGTIESIERRPGRIRVDADVPAGSGELLILEQAFPGWRVRIDDGEWQRPRTVDGFMGVALASGTHEVEFHYGWNTLPRRIGATITLLAVLALAILARRRSGSFPIARSKSHS